MLHEGGGASLLLLGPGAPTAEGVEADPAQLLHQGLHVPEGRLAHRSDGGPLRLPVPPTTSAGDVTPASRPFRADMPAARR